MTLPFIISIDPKTRFPMLEISGQNFAIAWLPITKIQIEYFLSETIDSRFDRAWYYERLKYSQRISPSTLTTRNYWQAFVTGITLDEVRTFSQWWGEHFDIPTVTEWRTALLIFDQVAAQNDFVEEVITTSGIHPRAQHLIRRIESALTGDQRQLRSSERKLSHQVLMRSGISEYVYEDANRTRVAACGLLNQALGSGKEGHSAQDLLTVLRHSDIGERMQGLGFRLILRKPEQG